MALVSAKRRVSVDHCRAERTAVSLAVTVIRLHRSMNVHKGESYLSTKGLLCMGRN